ncbi:transglutaminase family protein [Glacieibacterium megasporae]|uniref:transglutaminase family protein n=1 Tax=Glacieibacterium megasporae TaxID=2835787 RepID=UPI001C1E6E74|nr:transglutaminase family protein [Polymorphobacter megasporae]UAJ08902.1 transglutaminase family protein [Polymorphobacter megasporae]
MIYTINHRTTYVYEKPVGFARCVLRLTPATTATQTLLDSLVTVTPEPSTTLTRDGPFGERTQTIVIDKAHSELVITGHSRVDVGAGTDHDRDNSAPWEAVRAQAFGTRVLGTEGPAAYLYPTRRTPVVTAITDYARISFSPGRPIIAAAADLMERMYADFKYDPETTTVSTPAALAFEARSGVCQDFAHIMISGLHGLGLSAAYVSGYLRTNPPPGRPRLAGADATHAWVSVWCGETDGWIGFDPTNAVLTRQDHIVLAVGRDYSDVAPIDGIVLSPGSQTLKVEVDVVPESEMAAGERYAIPVRASVRQTGQS